MTKAEALKIRSVVEMAVTSLDDKTASEAPSLLARLKQDGSLLKAGTRINWNGTVKKAADNLWDTKENNPGNAPTLWDDILYRDGYRIIPDTITATTAFQKGEYGWWKDTLLESLIDANVYTPDQYSAGWKVVI